MRVVPAGDRLGDWASLRAEMFPDDDVGTHRAELEAGGRWGLLALDAGGAAVGLAELSVRRDYVNGLETSPAAFLEALYVREGARRGGAARALAAAAEEWARERGLAELGSDALLHNAAAHAVHRALEFEETERVVCFRRVLAPGG